MLKDEYIEIKWSSRSKEHYMKKGYTFTKLGEAFMVKTCDLTIGCHEYVGYKCDYCGEYFTKQYCSYIKQHSEEYGDCCKSCSPKKQAKMCFDKYGVLNPSQIDSVKKKRKETFIDRFGCENPSQSEAIKEKKKTTCLSNYGVESPLQSQKVMNKLKETCMERYGVEHTTLTDAMKEKSKATCIKKYGVDNVSKSPQVKRKIEETWIKKYGVKNIMELEEFRNKILQSFHRNGTAPTSKMQEKVSSMIKEIYGFENVEDNVPYGIAILDMILTIEDVKINIEYDGWYWHKSRQEQDKRRNYYLLNKGFKILRIRSNEEFPTKQQIIDGIDYLVKDNHSICFIDLDI